MTYPSSLKDSIRPFDSMTLIHPSACLAVSAKWYEFPQKFEWLAKKGFALEYTPDIHNLDSIPKQIDPFLSRGIRVRYHAFFPGYEIGNTHAHKAEDAMNLHFRMIDLIEGRGEQVVTVHVGLTPDIETDKHRTTENLGRLVQYGKQKGITVSLENLKKGPTKNPETVLNLAEQTGASITVDIGHAVSCMDDGNCNFKIFRMIELFAPHIIEVHYYEKETNRHHAPTDMTILGPIVDRLRTTKCRWWTIELESHTEIIKTQDLLFDYLVSTRKLGEQTVTSFRDRTVSTCPKRV